MDEEGKPLETLRDSDGKPLKGKPDWFLSKMDDEVMKMRANEDYSYSEAIREWWSWKNNELPFYSTVGEMPLETSIGYTYLARKYGRHDLVPHKEHHDDAVSREKQRLGIW